MRPLCGEASEWQGHVVRVCGPGRWHPRPSAVPAAPGQGPQGWVCHLSPAPCGDVTPVARGHRGGSLLTPQKSADAANRAPVHPSRGRGGSSSRAGGSVSPPRLPGGVAYVVLRLTGDAQRRYWPLGALVKPLSSPLDFFPRRHLFLTGLEQFSRCCADTPRGGGGRRRPPRPSWWVFGVRGRSATNL